MLSGPPVSATASADQLLERFLSSSARQRRSLLAQLQQRSAEIRPLIPDALDRLDATGDDWAAGSLIHALLEPVTSSGVGSSSANSAASGDGAAPPDGLAEAFLLRHPEGWLAVGSARGIDYAPLQRHLMAQEYEQADRITSEILRQLAGPAAVQRGYVYYSEVPPMPAVDLESIDRLWVTYSQGRFGFSVQLRLLRSLGGRWEQLWSRLGWKADGVWTRYPGSFTWAITAPEGHLPLVNQLRGVRLMDALLSHPALQQRVTA
ncbi:GUN4 domain-containing protein [Vulcanococcus limneticus]|uniref:GUN4 domain-containing protein n=1 Tax=Vulcanococcus limneticus TaxID=2170428 RepID=UPI00398BE95C